tara:strand:- start:218 stop:406 length:189 start_codon:yes stop_codon:yes gene_type:complete
MLINSLYEVAIEQKVLEIADHRNPSSPFYQKGLGEYRGSITPFPESDDLESEVKNRNYSGED